MRAKRLSDNPPNVCVCHSEPFGKLRTGSAKRVIVILSSAKDLEILRLTPQNDVVGQPPRRVKWCQVLTWDISLFLSEETATFRKVSHVKT